MFVQSSLLLCLSILFFLLLRRRRRLLLLLLQLVHCGALLEELTKSRFPFLSPSLSPLLCRCLSSSFARFFRSCDVEHYDKFFSFSLVGCRTDKSIAQTVRCWLNMLASRCGQRFFEHGMVKWRRRLIDQQKIRVRSNNEDSPRCFPLVWIFHIFVTLILDICSIYFHRARYPMTQRIDMTDEQDWQSVQKSKAEKWLLLGLSQQWKACLDLLHGIIVLTLLWCFNAYF